MFFELMMGMFWAFYVLVEFLEKLEKKYENSVIIEAFYQLCLWKSGDYEICRLE